MKITKRQLKRIVREAMHNYPDELRDEQDDAAHYEQMNDPEFQHKMDSSTDLHDLLLDYIWPCYQDGADAHECISHLGSRELHMLRGRQEEAVMINDNPEFIAFCIEIMDAIENL